MHMSLGKTAAVLALVATLTGCTAQGVPQDDAFAACLRDAGLTAPAEDASEEQVAGVMREPAALRCAVDELDGEELRSLMRAGFDESDDGPLLESLRGFVAASDRGANVLAQEAGTLVGSLDQEAEGWQPSTYEPLMAWEIYVRTEQEPPGFDRWRSQNPDRSGDDAVIVYVQELSGARDGSQEYATWVDINDIQSEVREARLEAAQS